MSLPQEIYVVEAIRYGDLKLGRAPTGAFSSREKAIIESIRYNDYRGGKYPSIVIYKHTLDTADHVAREVVSLRDYYHLLETSTPQSIVDED